MIENEINRVIAEYMGWTFCATHSPAPIFRHAKYADRNPSYFKYTDSLDACIPVVEKMDTFINLEYVDRKGFDKYYIYDDNDGIDELASNDSPSLALATALVVCIKEFNK